MPTGAEEADQLCVKEPPEERSFVFQSEHAAIEDVKTKPPEKPRTKSMPPPPRGIGSTSSNETSLSGDRLQQPRRQRARSAGRHTRTTENVNEDEEVAIYGNKDSYVVTGHGQAPQDYDHDWTNTYDSMWQVLTQKRHDMMRTCLLENAPVQYRSQGRSLEPLVFSGEV